MAAGKNGNIGTRNLFEATLLDEEGHMSWLDMQLKLLKRMGEPACTAMHITGSDANPGINMTN